MSYKCHTNVIQMLPMTVERYMAKVCSSAGIYEKIKTGNGMFIQYKE